MAKVSNEVRLIIALWKEKLQKRKDALAKETVNKLATRLAEREMEGLNFAENRLAEIISGLEEGKL